MQEVDHDDDHVSSRPVQQPQPYLSENTRGRDWERKEDVAPHDAAQPWRECVHCALHCIACASQGNRGVVVELGEFEGWNWV